MKELNTRVEIKRGYRAGEQAVITYIDEENNLCKVCFNDDEFYGYDTSDIEDVQI